MVLRCMATQEITDMLRMIFDVHRTRQRRGKVDLQIRERGIKNCKQNYTIPHAGSVFELVHIAVPNGKKKTKEPQEQKLQTAGISNRIERGGTPRRGRRNYDTSRDGSVEQTPFRGRKMPG